jgi:hypothetical protein
MGDPVKTNTGSRTQESKRRRIPDPQNRFLEYNYAASKAMNIKLILSRTLKFAEMENLVIQIFFHPGSGSRGQKASDPGPGSATLELVQGPTVLL